MSTVIIRKKLTKILDETINATLNLTVPLEDDTLASVDLIQVVSNEVGLTLGTPVINSVVLDEDEDIEIGKGVQFEVSEGRNNTEYKIKLVLTTTFGDELIVYCYILVSDQRPYYYGSVLLADDYFTISLLGDTWSSANMLTKIKCLVGATNAINQLAYCGTKTDSEQKNQFPRNGDTVVHLDIEYATYEIALKLLDGVDIDNEVNNLSAEARGYSGARTTYNRSFALDHLRAGIPSIHAWGLLKKYLIDPSEVNLYRVS